MRTEPQPVNGVGLPKAGPKGRGRLNVRPQEDFMNIFAKTGLALALGGAVIAGSVTESSARSWRPWAAGAAGFAVGAAVGAAAANANRGYYYGPGYAYEPGYAYGEPYAYAGEAYVAPSYGYSTYGYYNNPRCTSDDGYGRRSNCSN
jgi:hypothetical protein